MVTPPDIEAHILRFYHAEKWTIGTIARQLHIHHSVVRRVLAQAGLPRVGPQRSQERTHFCSPELTQRVRIGLWLVGETGRYPTCLKAIIPLFDCRDHSSVPTWVPQDMASAGGQ